MKAREEEEKGQEESLEVKSPPKAHKTVAAGSKKPSKRKLPPRFEEKENEPRASKRPQRSSKTAARNALKELYGQENMEF
jgi:hypothetical protein